MPPFLGDLWCFVRVLIQSSRGRQRFKACPHQIIAVTNDASSNAASVGAWLTKIRDSISDGLPSTNGLDKLRYQHCRRVIDYAAALARELLFLPPYSPNRPLIARLWRFVRSTALSPASFNSFVPFKAAMPACLDQSQTTDKNELQSLLVLKFQTFRNVTL